MLAQAKHLGSNRARRLSCSILHPGCHSSTQECYFRLICSSTLELLQQQSQHLAANRPSPQVTKVDILKVAIVVCLYCDEATIQPCSPCMQWLRVHLLTCSWISHFSIDILITLTVWYSAQVAQVWTLLHVPSDSPQHDHEGSKGGWHFDAHSSCAYTTAPCLIHASLRADLWQPTAVLFVDLSVEVS